MVQVVWVAVGGVGLQGSRAVWDAEAERREGRLWFLCECERSMAAAGYTRVTSPAALQ